MPVEDQIKRIIQKANLNYSKKNSIFLRDFKDGEIYSDFLETENGKLIQTGRCFTLFLNIDGISLCKKSKLSMWPVILVINEIDINTRYSFDNIIIAGKFLKFFLKFYFLIFIFFI